MQYLQCTVLFPPLQQVKVVPLELPVIQAHKGLKELVDELVPQVGAVNVQSVRQKRSLWKVMLNHKPKL